MEAFATVVRNTFDILASLDSAISSQPRGSLEWYVAAASFGSLIVTIESRSKLPDVDYGPEIAQSLVRGLAHIQQERTTPPYFSDYDLRKANQIARTLRKNGAKAVRIVDTQEEASATIEPEISQDIERLVNIRYQEMGSVEGKLEMISIHGTHRFSVWHAITQHSIRCRFHNGELLAKVKDALGRRVVVYGAVHFNYQHEPIKVDVEDLETLPGEKDLPLPKEVRGIAPDFTGDLSTQEYLRGLRG